MQEYIKNNKTKITNKVFIIVLKIISNGLNKVLPKLVGLTIYSPQCLHFIAFFFILSAQ